jgi:hypothetical protein
MNREDIMQLMEEAGFNTNFFSPDGVDKFGRFAQLVAAAEREAWRHRASRRRIHRFEQEIGE